jgi:hypothetical protein
MSCSLRQNLVDDLELSNLAKHDGQGYKVIGNEQDLAKKQDEYLTAVLDKYGVQEDVFTVEDSYVQFNEPLLEEIYRIDNGIPAPPTDEAIEAEQELLNSVNVILRKLGLTSKAVDKLRDREGNPIKGVAVADILNRSIQYLEGKQEEVPEEVIHFFVQALKELNDPLYVSMAERVHKEPEYAEVLISHSDLGYSEEDLLDEAIAKVILNRILTTLKTSKPGVQELFDSNPELANEVYESLGFRQNSVEEFQGFWNRQQVATQTDKVFLFGDNTNDRTVTKYVPSMTQAVIRGLPNAIGVDTKKDRGTSATSYLTDADFDAFKNHVDSQIKLAKDSGKTIVIPADGIGTGKAMLKEKAPKLFEYLQQELNKLKQHQITPQQKQQALQLYSQYLDTIFPDSQVKDIVYRGDVTTDYIKEKTGIFGKGIYFSEGKFLAKFHADKVGGKVNSAILNLKNPNTEYYYHPDFKEKEGYKNVNKGINIKESEDGVVGLRAEYSGEIKEYVAFDLSQVHILGNKQDIERFKEFVGKPIEATGDRNTRWWGRVKKKLESVFNVDGSDPFMQAAKEMFQNDLSRYADAISTSKRDTLFRSIGTTQDILREKLKINHNSLELTDVTRDQITGKMGDNAFETLSRGGKTISRYMDKLKGKVVTWRGTDKASLSYARNVKSIKKFGIEETGEESAADIGTRFHSVMQGLTVLAARSKAEVGKDADGKPVLFKDLFDVVNLDGFLGVKDGELVKLEEDDNSLSWDSLGKMSGVSNERFTDLAKSAQNVIRDLAEVQLELNKKSGKADKIDLFTELKVKFEDTAGTIDLLLVLSDGSTGIYDYKFKVYKQLTLKLDASPFREESKLEGFEDQMAFYNKALSDLGINPMIGVRRMRIVPGAIHIANNKLQTVKVGEEFNKFLNQIPLLGEMADSDLDNNLYKMNETLQEMNQEFVRLKAETSTPTKSKRIATLRNAIKDLLTRSDMVQTLDDMVTLHDSLVDNLKITDKKNPLYINSELTHSALGMIEIYSMVASNFEDVKLKISPETKAKIKALLIQFESIKTTLKGRVLADVEDTHGFSLTAVNSPLVAAHKFLSFNETGNEIISFASRILDDANAMADNDYRAFYDEWKVLDDALVDWAKANGKTVQDAYNAIHRTTKTSKKLVKKFSDSFSEERDAMLELGANGTDVEKGQALAWMQKHYQIKDGAKENYESFLQFTENRLLQRWGSKTHVLYEKELERFKDNYDVFSRPKTAFIYERNHKFLELKEEYLEPNYSSEYKELKKGGNEPLLNYYNAWLSAMSKFDNLLETHIDSNMIPNVHASAIERWVGGNFGWEALKMNLAGSLIVDTNDEYSDGDNSRRTIPLKFMNPLRDSKGEIDPRLISAELTPSLLHFAHSVFRNHRRNAVEGDIQMAKRFMETATQGVWKNGVLIKSGKEVIAVSAEAKAKLDKLIEMKMYDMGLGSTVGGKRLQFAMSMFSKIVMTMPIKSSIAAISAGVIFSKAQLKSNPNFGEASMMDSMKLMFEDAEKFDAIPDYFNIYQEGELNRHSRALRHNLVERWVNSDYLYSPLRQADEMGDRRMFVAMMHNFHLTEDGEFIRLDRMPEGTEPFAKQLKIENGVLVNKILPGQKSRMERMFRAEMAEIRGNNTPESIAEYQSEIALSALMQFKSWMPPMALARFGSTSYDRNMERLKEGRYRGLYKAMRVKNSDQDLMEGVASGLLLQSVATKASHLVSSLMSDRNYTLTSRERERLKKIDAWPEHREANFQSRRARFEAEFNAIKMSSNNPTVHNMSIEEFFQMREASVRSSLYEMKTILILMVSSLLMSLSLDDDDDDSYAERQTAEILTRTLMEVAMFANPLEVLKLNSGVPVLGMLDMAANVGSAVADAGWNAMSGKDLDKSGERLINTSLKFIPGSRNAAWVFGMN